jgi:predicted O-methyltransferase YrrM
MTNLDPLDLLAEIYSSGNVETVDGELIHHHSGITAEQGNAILKVAETTKARVILELGLAYGLSSLHLSQLALKNGSKYIAIDPDQKTYWKSVGLTNLKRVGLADQLKFMPTPSTEALIELMHDQIRLDFVFLDYVKVFDVILTDFRLIDKMMSIGGCIVFDDCTWPGIRSVVRYIAQLPHYEICMQWGKDQSSLGRSIHKSIIENLTLTPHGFTDGLFPNRRKCDRELAVNYFCIGFRKIAEDMRSWDYFHPI